MKKLTSLMLALCLGAFVVGCGGDEEPAPSTPSTPATGAAQDDGAMDDGAMEEQPAP